MLSTPDSATQQVRSQELVPTPIGKPSRQQRSSDRTGKSSPGEVGQTATERNGLVHSRFFSRNPPQRLSAVTLVPVGTAESSPALQCWVAGESNGASPVGTAEPEVPLNRPYGTSPLVH